MNRNLNTILAAFFVALFFHVQKAAACGFDFTGSCATSAQFAVNSVSKDYFVSPCSYGVQLPTSLGTGITTLQLTNASTRTWESCTNNVAQSAVFYRIYSNPLNKGAFIKVDLTQLVLFSSPPYRTKTYSNSPNSDFLTGLQSNTLYTLELYYQLSVDTDGNGSIDVTPVLDNAGAFYVSSFQTGNIATNTGFPVNVTTQNVTCNGGTNGACTAVPLGGTAPYTYLWSNNATTATTTGLSAGTYTLTVTDATTATGTRSVIITSPPTVNGSLTTTNPGCGLTNGAINAAGFGGTAPYTYLWNTAATTPSVSNLAQGTYSVTVKDVNNCTGTASTTLTENCTSGLIYCASNGQAPWGEWIAGITVNTLNNPSDKTRPDRYAVGYSDWKDKSTSLTKALSYPLSITPGLSWSGAQTNLFFRVWIDFNKNGVFDDIEKVFEKNSVGIAHATGNITIPASALTGITVMRVGMKKDAYPTACESFAAGEVEDYTIVIAAGSGNPCLGETTPPVISNCPQSIIVTTSGTTAIATWPTPTATDNCTPTPILTSNFTSGQSFPLGTTNVIYTATDTSNNTATCTFPVTVSKVLATPTVVLKNASASVQKTQKVCVAVTVDSFNNLISAKWVNQYNATVLRYDSVTNLNTALGLTTAGNFLASAGEVRFTWNNATAATLADGVKLYDMCFTALGNGGTSSTVAFVSSGGTTIEMLDNLSQVRAFSVQAGTVSVIDTTIQNVCKKYTASNTNEICQATWKPYGMLLVQNNVPQNLQAQAVAFDNSGTTAILRGTFRTATWAPVVVTINLSGGTTVAPAGSPRTTITATCPSGITGAGFTYYTTMSGTVVMNGQTLTITRRGAAFQVGIGANLQNTTDVGASGQFTLSDGTLGEFGLKLVLTAAACGTEPLVSTTKPVLNLEAYNAIDKAELIWVNNTSYNNDYFEIQKADANGDFKKMETLNEQYVDDKLHTHNFTDAQPTEGDNYYRIKTVLNDGKTLFSAVKTLKFSNFNDVVVFPNPTSNTLFLGMKKYENAAVKIVIYNSIGLIEKQFEFSKIGTQAVELDVENLKIGNYFMRIIAQGKRDMVKQFIKIE